MIDLVLSLLGSGLSLWASKEKTKYQDKYIQLKEKIYAEYNKPEVDDAVMDNLHFELQLLCVSFSAEVGAQNLAPKP